MGFEELGSGEEFRKALQVFGRSMSLDPVQLRRIGEDLIAVANTISAAELESYKHVPVARDEVRMTDNRLANLASSIYQARRKRAVHLAPDLLAEPAWDMLLDLFVAEVRNKQVSVTSLCIASDVPATTALRWISILEKKGLIRREEVPADRRVNELHFTPAGRRIVRDTLTDCLGVTMI